MKRFLYKFVFFILPCILMLSINAVYGAWHFADLPIVSIGTEVAPSLELFEYTPEEVLPGGDTPVENMGENHLKMLQNLVNEPSYGLNATKKPILHELLNEPGDAVYSNQNVTGGNLKHLMPDFSSETEKLYFVIVYVSDTEYHAYTLLASDILMPIGTSVLAYKSVLAKNEKGVWVATASYVGYAKVNDPGVVSRSIDVTSWSSHYS